MNYSMENFDDLDRYIAQSQGVVTSLICDDNYKHLSSESLSNVLWLISDRLDDMQSASEKIFKAERAAKLKAQE